MLFVTFGKHILHQISLHWEAFHNGSMTIITSKNKTSLPYWVHSRLLEIRKVKLTFYEIQPSTPECHSIQKAGTHIGKVAVRASVSLTCRPRLASCRVSVTNTVPCYTGRMGILIYQRQALLSALKNRVSAPKRFRELFAPLTPSVRA